ncbi:MAG: TIGR04282 family arsenosugar biosynthesis glycosyltransferase [Micromonosporaceae bacterium]
MTTLIVIAKAPVPGRVKTRLSPPFTLGTAAALAEAALADTLESVRDAATESPVLALDGTPGDWLPPGFTVVPQADGGLDVRIAAAFEAAAERSAGPALLIGMDTPQLPRAVLEPSWEDIDALLGPACDGGYWALGFSDPDPETVRRAVIGVPMSRPDTGPAQLARLRATGLRTQLMPMMRDIDTAADAYAVARLCPGSRFAKLLDGLDSLDGLDGAPGQRGTHGRESADAAALR